MEVLVRLNSSRAGHDKLVRTAQYACRLVAASTPEARLAASLGDVLASSRKLLRLGTCLEVLRSSLATVSHPDLTLRLTLTLSRYLPTLVLELEMWHS